MHRRALYLLAAILLALHTYRAATQSLTTDEAFTFNRFLDGSLSKLLGQYDANNHVLYSLLARISIALFGVSELSLRLPALFGALVFFVALIRLATFLFPHGFLALALAAWLGLNPHLMDFMSAARGYGLAIGLFMWSLERTLRWAAGRDPQILYRVALGLALSVASNLTLLVPALALGLLIVGFQVAAPEPASPSSARERWWQAVDNLVVPGIVTAFVVLVVPLSKAAREHFYVGESTLGRSLESLAEMSLFHHPLPDPRARLLLGPNFWYPVLKVAVPALLVWAAVAWALLLLEAKRKPGDPLPTPAAKLVFFGAGCFILSFTGLVAAHLLLGVPYPYARTGLYLLPLAAFSAAALWAQLPRVARIVATVPLGALASLSFLHFALAFQLNHYGEWRFDRSTKHIVHLIRTLHAEHPKPEVRVGASWVLEPTLNFYRRLYRLDWMHPVDRSGPDAEYDYYILLAEDGYVMSKRKLEPIWSDPLAGITLARPYDRIP